MEVGNVSASLRLDFAQFTSGLRESGQQAKAFESSTSQAFGQMAQDVQASLGEVANAVRDLSQVYLQQKQLDRDLADSARQAADARADAARQAQQAARQAADAARQAAAEERAAIESVAQAQRDAARATQQAQQQQQQRQGHLRDSLQTVGGAMTKFGAATSLAVGGGVYEFAKFDGAMRNVNSIAKLSEDEFGTLKEQILKMSEAGGTQGPTELANALYDINSSGIAGAEGLNVLAISSKAATAGVSDTKTSAELIVGTLNAYGMSASQAQHVSDVLFKTVENGQTTYSELAQSMGNVMATAKTAGISLEELTGAVALMTVKGIKTPEAITDLKSLITHLVAPGQEAAETMKALGININEDTIKTTGLNGALDELMTKTGGSMKVLKKILEDEGAVTAALDLGGDKKFGEFTQQNKNSEGSTDNAYKQIIASLKSSLESTGALLQAFAIRMTSFVVPATAMLADALKNLVKWFEAMPAGLQQFIVVGTAVAGVVSGVAGALILLSPALAPLIALGEGALVAAGAVASAVTPTAALVAGLGAVATAMAPIAAAFAGVAAAAALLYVAWRDNWGGIQQTAATVWAYLQEGFNTLVTTIPPLWDSMWGSITAAATSAWTAIQPGVQAGVSFLTQAWGSIAPVVETALQVLVPMATLAFNTMLTTLQTIWAVMQNAWSVLWAGFSGVVATVWPIVSNYVLAGLDVLKGVVAAGMAILKGDWSAAWEAFKGILSDVWGHMKAAFEGALNGITQLLTNFGSTVYNAGANIAKQIAAGILSEVKAVQNAITDAIYGGNKGLDKMTVPSNGLVDKGNSASSAYNSIPGAPKTERPNSAQGAYDTATKAKRKEDALDIVDQPKGKFNSSGSVGDTLTKEQSSDIKKVLARVESSLEDRLAAAGQDKEARKAAYAQALQDLQQSALKDAPAILKKAHDYRVSLTKEQVSINEQAEREQTATLKREAKEREAEQKKQAAAGEDLKKRVQDQRVNDAGRKVDTLSKEAQDGKDVSGQLIDAVRERLRLQFQAIDAAAAKERAAVADTAQNRQLIDEETARKKNALIDEEKQKLLDLAKTAQANNPASVDPSKQGFDGFKLPTFTLTLPSKSPFDDPTKANPNATPLQAFANSLEGMKTSYTTATDRLTTSMDKLNTTLQDKNPATKTPGAPGATGDSNYQKKLASEQPALGTGSASPASGARNADGSYGANLEEMRRQAAAANARTEAAGGSTSGAGAAAAGATSQTIINLNGVEIGTDGKEALTKFAEAAKRKANTSMSPAGGFMGGIG